MFRVGRTSDIAGIRALMKSVIGFWDDAWRADVLERVLGSTETIAFVHLEAGRIDGFICAQWVKLSYLRDWPSPTHRCSPVSPSGQETP